MRSTLLLSAALNTSRVKEIAYCRTVPILAFDGLFPPHAPAKAVAGYSRTPSRMALTCYLPSVGVETKVSVTMYPGKSDSFGSAALGRVTDFAALRDLV